MLAELIATHGAWVVQYIEHDSLLENKADEELTEEERKVAWEEYEHARAVVPDSARQLAADYFRDAVARYGG